MATPSNNTPPRPPSNPNPLTSSPTLLPPQSQPQPPQQQQQQQPPPQPIPSSPFQGLFRSPLHSQTPGGHLQPPRGPSPFQVQPPSSPAPNPKRLPQKPPPRPPPPSSSSSPSPSSFKSSELTPASARRKKPKLPDKRLPDRVAALLPESPLYTQLLEFESRVDAALSRKKTDIQEALKSPPSMQRTLRIYIFNTSSNQSTPKSPSSEPPSWTLRIIGRILEDTIPENNINNHHPDHHPMFPKFSFFLKRLTISLDPTLYPENPTIVWENSRAAVPQEGFEVRRIGDKEFTVGIRLEMNYNPEKFKLSPALVELLGVEVESRARIIAAIWHYVKARKLQNPSDPSFFACDPALKKVFGEDRMKFALVSQKISQHLSPPPPIHLEHRVKLLGSTAGPLGTACYDVLVDVPFSLQKEMSTFLANTEKHKEIEACDEVILASIKKIHEHRRRRAFFLGFSQSPVEFINALIASQTRDLKQVAGDAGRNAEKERRSDFYNQPWVEDAVIRYLNRKPTPGTDAPGST